MPEQNQKISIPAAIIIAGALIAGAVYFSNVGPSQLPLAATPTPQATPTRRVASLAIAPITSEDHMRGLTDAPITVVEYSDLECPYCKVFHQSMLRILAEYSGTVRWVYRHAPLARLHTKAFTEANAAECAAAQGKFWEFTDVVFAVTSSNDSLDITKIPEYAKEAGVQDIPAFQKCIDVKQFQAKIEQQLQDGLQAGLEGTPFNMIIKHDGTKTQLGGGLPYEQLKKIIDAL